MALGSVEAGREFDGGGSAAVRAVRGALWACSRPFAWVARARGWRWFVLVGVECLLAVIAGAALWVATGRLPIPDVGEPFDVAAFKARALAPERNAYPLFERALEVYRDSDRPPEGVRPGQSPPVYPNDPKVGRWLDANRGALALFLEGCARPDALLPDDPASFPRSRGYLALRSLARLALEEGARREQRGDMGGAWACYYAVLRGAKLVGRHASLNERQIAQGLRDVVLPRLPIWANDPQTAPAQLRRALDDLYALEGLKADEADTIKSIYVQAIGGLDTPRALWGGASLADILWTPAPPMERFKWVTVYPLRRWRAGEPESSRRVVRSFVAQRLAYLETPPDRRPAPALWVVIRDQFRTFPIDLYPVDPGAPRAARAVEPKALAGAIVASPDLQYALVWPLFLLRNFSAKERSDQAGALYSVAEALYRRDHAGAPPPSDEALVGPYLKGLPVEPVSPADGSAPVVDAEL